MIQTQQPVSIPEASSEPEPDAAIVLRPSRTSAKPTAAEVACVIEVAGTSLRRDRTTKLRHYALGGIPQYILINLADRTAEEYLLPRPQDGVYGESVVHSADATLCLRLAGDERLDVLLADLLPTR
jgi:Uma2 family endonuclease